MASYFLNRSKANSLASQIRAAERQVLNRQRRISIRTGTLVRNIEQQMTAPSTLLLVSGAGFIIGELTKRKPSKVDGSGHTTKDTGISPLKVALNLVTSIQTLSTALPIVWLMKSFIQPDSSSQLSNEQFQTTASASDRTENSKSQS
ncbi:MAG: hypothetical protein ABL884_04015 [Methyloglobulus sp.]